MTKFTVFWQPHTSTLYPTVIQAKYINYGDQAVVLHNGTPDNPVAVLPYENFRLIDTREREDLR